MTLLDLEGNAENCRRIFFRGTDNKQKQEIGIGKWSCFLEKTIDFDNQLWKR